MEELLKAVEYSKVWIDMFNRVKYEDAFKQYKENFAEVFKNAIKNCCSIDNLALDFVNAIEKGWEKEKFWNKKSVKIDQKMVITVFLTPMLLSLEDESCHTLANEINRAWNKRFSNDTYLVADHDEIVSGFTNSIFGLKR